MFSSFVVPIRPTDEWFMWYREPPTTLPDGARFYIDGSLFDGSISLFARTGYGVALVAVDGELLAFGAGVPPSWIHNAAGAESFALYAILRFSEGFPRVTTDCKGVLDMLVAGYYSATAAARPLARICGLIFGCLDNQFDRSLLDERLLWMPSHGALHTIGVAKKSNGQAISNID